MIEIRNVTKAFGGTRAVSDCSISLDGLSISGLIGPNGSGKTTLFNLITGLLKPDSGEIRFLGNRIDGRLPHDMAALGLIRTFQLSRVFPRMTVLENMLLAVGEVLGELVVQPRETQQLEKLQGPLPVFRFLLPDFRQSKPQGE